MNDANATLNDVIKVTITYERAENFEVLKNVFRKFFKKGFLARKTLSFNEFLNPNIMIQVEAIAYKLQNK